MPTNCLAKRVKITLVPSELISEIRAHIRRLEEKNITTLGTWVCGHAELEPHELANKHAKLAAEKARDCSRQASTSLSEAKSAIKQMTLTKWQRGWHKSGKGRHLYSLLPYVKRSSFKSMHNRTAERKINRLRLGHTNLKADLTHKKIIENPMCKCELAHETPLHVLFHCKLYDTERESLITFIELMYVQKQFPYYLRTIDVDTSWLQQPA